MKTIETHISEMRFLNRLENLCRKKTRFDRGYGDRDTFVIKRKNNKFWLAKYYALLGRNRGYSADCLYCKYNVNECGFVSVSYRFGQRITYRIPFILSLVLGIGLLVSAIYDAIVCGNLDWNEIAVAILFWILGMVGVLIRSKKERKVLEEHLLRICKGRD